MKQKLLLLLAVFLMGTVTACQSEQLPVADVGEMVMPNPVEEPENTFVKNYTFSGRYMVEEWVDTVGKRYYQLEDGTVLLRLHFSEEDVYNPALTEDVESSLTEEARDNMELYFKQMFLYDLQEELSYAYDQYQSLGEEFQEHSLDFTISQSYATDEALFFTGSLTYAITGGYVANEAYRVIFHRDTGEEMLFWDIFTVPQEEVVAFFRELIGDYPEMQAIMWAFNSRNMYIGDDFAFIETNYVKHEVRNAFAESGDVTLSYNAGMGIDVADLAPILQPWVYG